MAGVFESWMKPSRLASESRCFSVFFSQQKQSLTSARSGFQVLRRTRTKKNLFPRGKSQQGGQSWQYSGRWFSWWLAVVWLWFGWWSGRQGRGRRKLARRPQEAAAQRIGWFIIRSRSRKELQNLIINSVQFGFADIGNSLDPFLTGSC